MCTSGAEKVWCRGLTPLSSVAVGGGGHENLASLTAGAGESQECFLLAQPTACSAGGFYRKPVKWGNGRTYIKLSLLQAEAASTRVVISVSPAERVLYKERRPTCHENSKAFLSPREQQGLPLLTRWPGRLGPQGALWTVLS